MRTISRKTQVGHIGIFYTGSDHFHTKHFPETVALSFSNFFYFVDDKDYKADGTQLFDFIKPCANLKHLELQHPYDVTDEDMMLLAKHCTNLTSISMVLNLDYDVHQIEMPVRTLGQLTQLRSINISGETSSETMDDDICIFDNTISEALVKCTQLTHIDLHNSCVGKEGIKALAMNCTMLTSVHLGVYSSNEFSFESGKGAAYFGIHCPYLTEIDLSGTGVEDADIIQLVAGCPNLKAIDISRTQYVTDASVLRIAECHNLEWIGLDACLEVSCPALQVLNSSLLSCLISYDPCDGCCENGEWELIEAKRCMPMNKCKTVWERQQELLEELQA